MSGIIFACVLCFVFSSCNAVQCSASPIISQGILLLFARIDAPTTFHVQSSEQGYWYAKALNYDPDFPEDVRFLACKDSDSLKYFDSAKSIDDDFLNEVMRIFDQLHPNAYKNPKMCLAHFHAICPSNLQQDKILRKFFNNCILLMAKATL